MPAASPLLRGHKNTPGMSSIARRAANQRELKEKSPTAEKKEFSGFARRQDAEIPGVFQGRQHSKTKQFTLSAPHCTLIVLSGQRRKKGGTAAPL